jgi:hypothetical protein
MKVVKINNKLYGIIEDGDDLKLLIGYAVNIYNMADEPDFKYLSGQISSIDDIGQVHGSWGSLAIIPEVDNFEVSFTIRPAIISEERFKELCDSYNLDPKSIDSTSMDIHKVLTDVWPRYN